MGSAVEIALLGEVIAGVDGHNVELGPARQRCVRAALAVDVNRAVPVSRLTERVWGDEPPPRARAMLHSYLSRLRQAFADTGIRLDNRPNGYVLIADESAVDLLRFRKLRGEAGRRSDDQDIARILTEATSLWRGEPLTGIGGEWADLTRDQLAREHDAAELDLIDARLRLGHKDRPGPGAVAGTGSLAASQRRP